MPSTSGTEPLPTSSLALPPALASVLQEHQVAALHFLWRRLVDEGFLRMAARTHGSTLEQRAQLYQEVYGAIVGHSMGLGKTLTAVSFIHLLHAQALLMSIKRQQVRRGTGREAREAALCPALRTLVVCPKSCVPLWLDCVREWVRPDVFGRMELPVYAPSTLASPGSKLYGRRVEEMLRSFHVSGGILMLGYEEYTRMTASLAQRPPAVDWNGERVGSILDAVRQRLPLRPRVRYIDVLEGVDLVVLDEAHRLRRATSVLVQRMRTHLRCVQLRVALTGTPLQNHLEEYNVMRSVVTGSDLNGQQFSRYFVTPIQMGQCVDSSYQQFVEMQRCVASLRKYFAATLHHCGPEVLERALPPRREFVFFFNLSAVQEAVYLRLLAHFRAVQAAHKEGSAALVLHHQSSHVCLHPCLVDPALLSETVGEGELAPYRTPSLPGGRGRVTVASTTSLPYRGEAAGGAASAEGELLAAEDLDEDSVSASDADEGEDVKGLAEAHEGSEGVDPLPNVADSPKLLFAVELIDHITNTLGEKVVVFSLYHSHLAFLRRVLLSGALSETQDPPNIFCGGTTDAQRDAYVADFGTNPQRRVLLCSVRAGGVGINLTAANHCILLDVSWNPADDTQATYRVYRFGQHRPVTVYRLATRGTTEHVVFGYALHKSWLHRKIVDVMDPTRQERHARKSYFMYPCPVPIDDGLLPETVPAAATGSQGRGTRKPKSRSDREGAASLDSAAAADEGEGKAGPHGEAAGRVQRSRAALALCERVCPAAATVLARNAALRGSLYTLLQRSFLLRDESSDTIAEMESRFLEALKRREAQAPIALADEEEPLLAAQQAAGRDRGGALMEECEGALIDMARTAAHHLIWHVVQRRHDAGLLSVEADTTAVVREADRALCELLHPLLTVVPEVGDGAGPRPGSSFTFQSARPEPPQAPPPARFSCLAEALLFAYQAGVQETVSEVLSRGTYAKLRTLLASRVPREEGRGMGGRRPRHRSTLTHGVLEEALLYRPYALLSRVDALELTYVATEMGFVRPVVEQCLFIGLRRCLARAREGGTAATARAARTLLREHLRCWAAVLSHLGGSGDDPAVADEASDGDDSGSTSSGDGWGSTGAAALSSSQRERASWSLDLLVPSLVHALDRCLEDLWPAGEGFELPPLPLELEKEESRVAAAYTRAGRLQPSLGLLSMAQAAALLKLAAHNGYRGQYGCPRCRGVSLQRSSDTVLACPLCHYNAEAAVGNEPRCQQAAILYQLSLVCNLLDAFSISRSFSTDFAPATCASAWDVLQRLHTGQAAFHFVKRCVSDGMDLLLTEYPTKYVQLLSIQCGAGEDREWLRRLLLANGRYVWSYCLRGHVREGLVACFRDLVEPCGVASLASMPLMPLVLALYFAAGHEEVAYASELLASGDTAGDLTSSAWAGSRRRGLLRFACDALVKLLYAEKLVEHCKVPPTEDTTTDPAQAAGGAEVGESSSDLDELHIAEESSSTASAEALPPALGAFLRQASSSPSSSATESSGFAVVSIDDASDGSGTPLGCLSSSSLSSEGSDRPQRRRPRLQRSSDSASSLSSSSLSTSGRSLSASRTRGGRAATEPAAGGDDEEEEGPGGLAEQRESEAVLQQRSAQYWVAFCEVYGTQSVESLTVYVEDEEQGMTMLPPPPQLFWVSHLQKASREGRTVRQVIDVLVQKLLDLSRRTRLVGD